MTFDFLTNLGTCASLVSYEFFGVSNIGVIYYTHIPVILISLLIGTLVFIKNRNALISKILFSLSIFFAIWSILDMFTWISFNSITIMVAWALTGIFQILIYIASLYFIYVFVNKKDLPLYQKIIIGILFLPILILTPTTYNLTGFSYTDCTAIEGNMLNNYFYILQSIFVIWILIISVIGIIKLKGVERKETILSLMGILFFLLSFFVTGYLSVYLSDQGIATGYFIESFGLFGMVIFMVFLAYLIVKFKVFNIKLIAAQALVWSLIILIGSQFFYLNQMSLFVTITTTITLIISAILGLILVRSVKKEITLREKLEVANAGQTNLIHVMNHQIKGYLGKNKDIFAELLTDDYGNIPESAKPLVEEGLNQSSTGVQYVMDILRGNSAENGTLTYDMKLIDFKNLVTVAVSKEKETADKKGLKLDFNVENGRYDINADPEHLNEAIRNLIDNSIYYTPKGGVSVNLQNKSGRILLSVKDTGIGIKDEDKSKLFKAGGVGRDSIKVNVNSSGYGLVFAKGVIEAHKGKIWFESAGPGTTFFVDLPLAGK